MDDLAPTAHEPAFNSPWPAMVMPIAILVAYAFQSRMGNPDLAGLEFGFSPAAFAQGRWGGLLTALFVHSGWLHVAINAISGLAFGAPVARWIGVRGLRPMIFFALYFFCGVVGNLGFALVHPGAPIVLVGASGAVSGLMGAASRMIGVPGPAYGLAPFTNSTVIGFGVAWIIVNALMAVFGAPGFAAGAPVAWEAHLFGYAAGLLMIGPVLWLGRSKTA